MGTIAFTAITDDWSTWQVSEVLAAECPAGLFSLRLTAIGIGPNVDHLTVATSSNVSSKMHPCSHP